VVGNLIPYHLPSSFSTSGFFLYVHFYRQTPGTSLLHPVVLVGVTDPVNFGVLILESSIDMGISTVSNAHNFVKNLVCTSFYSPFWSSLADLSFAPSRWWLHHAWPWLHESNWAFEAWFEAHKLLQLYEIYSCMLHHVQLYCNFGYDKINLKKNNLYFITDPLLVEQNSHTESKNDFRKYHMIFLKICMGKLA
jgi:hypothetical protein